MDADKLATVQEQSSMYDILAEPLHANTRENHGINDPVNHPNHYTEGGIECIEGIEASMTSEAYRGYLKGCCLKYLWRYEKKDNPVQDLEKARWYLDRLIIEIKA